MIFHLDEARSDVNIATRTISSSAREASNLIHRMSPREQRDLRAKLSMLLSDAPAVNNQSSDVQPSDGVDWLLCGIEEVLRARGILSRKSRLQPKIIYPKYGAPSRPAMTTRVAALGGRPRAADLAALGKLAAECLADHIESMRVLVTPRTMLQHAGEAAAAVSAAFPGYLASGMLGMCMGWHGDMD